MSFRVSSSSMYCATVDALHARSSLVAIHGPEIANRGHFEIVLFLQLRGDPPKLRAATPHADVPKQNTLIRTLDAAVGKGRSAQRTRRRYGRDRVVEKGSSIDRLYG